MNSPETILQVVKKAKAKIQQGWCKGAEARDKNGKKIASWKDDACKWCLAGAVSAVISPNGPLEEDRTHLNFKLYCDVETVIRRVVRETMPAHVYGIVDYNDRKCRSQTQMLKLLERVIVDLESQMVSV